MACELECASEPPIEVLRCRQFPAVEVDVAIAKGIERRSGFVVFPHVGSLDGVAAK